MWQGRLHNPAGAPIATARVTLRNEKRSASAVTADDGGFHLEPLGPGAYRLTIEANGRSSEFAQVVDLEPGTPSVNIALSDRGEIALSSLQQGAATGGEALSSQAVSELPLNKRDFSQLLLLAAGTMTDANGATNFTAAVRHQRPARR